MRSRGILSTLAVALSVGLSGCGDQIKAAGEKLAAKQTSNQTSNYVAKRQAALKDLPNCATFKEQMAEHGRQGTIAQGTFMAGMQKTYDQAKAAGCVK